jgi:hypothetical protein
MGRQVISTTLRPVETAASARISRVPLLRVRCTACLGDWPSATRRVSHTATRRTQKRVSLTTRRVVGVSAWRSARPHTWLRLCRRTPPPSRRPTDLQTCFTVLERVSVHTWHLVRSQVLVKVSAQVSVTIFAGALARVVCGV